MEFKKSLWLLKEKLKYYFIINFFGSRNYTKFIILTQSRTGSNLLVDILNGHQSVLCRNEIFRLVHGKESKEILFNTWEKQPKHIKASGFKIFYEHPNDTKPHDIWKTLKEDNSIRVIHLGRDNLIKMVLSRKIAFKTGIWIQRNNTTESSLNKRVSISLREIYEAEELTNNEAFKFKKIFENHKCYNLTYEDVVADKQQVANSLFNFLGIPQCKIMKTSLRKQNTEGLENLISNYKSFKEEVSGTRFEKYLD